MHTRSIGSLGGLREALKKWRFFVAVENGKAAASTIDIRIPSPFAERPWLLARAAAVCDIVRLQ